MQQIAEMTNKSLDSVKNYRKNILEKLDVTNISSAVLASINRKKLQLLPSYIKVGHPSECPAFCYCLS